MSEQGRWVPEDHIYESASGCIRHWPEQAAALVYTADPNISLHIIDLIHQRSIAFDDAKEARDRVKVLEAQLGEAKILITELSQIMKRAATVASHWEHEAKTYLSKHYKDEALAKGGAK